MPQVQDQSRNMLTSLGVITYGRDLQARQFSDLRTCESIHRVCADLQRELSAIQHFLLEWISRFLEVFLGSKTEGNRRK